MKKSLLCSLSILMLLSGCVHKKSKKEKPVKAPKKVKDVQVEKHINIPLASDEVKSYFDDSDDINLGEFVLVAPRDEFDSSPWDDREDKQEKQVIDLETNIDSAVQVEQSGQVAKAENEINLSEDDLDDFSWVQEVESEDGSFKKCHFNFDQHKIKEDQEKIVEDNIALAKDLLAKGDSPLIVIEGHSCHSAGSMTYNMVLSEKRAKAVSDRFIAAGIPAENIKIVPRGQEVPEKDNFGNTITGSRDDQWANRRSEIRVVYS